MPRKQRKSLSRGGRRKKSKKNSWKKLNFSYKLKRKIRLLALALIVVISTAVIFTFISLWQLFKTPFAQAADFSGQQTFQKDRRYNILLILLEDQKNPQTYIKNLSLLSIDGPNGSFSLISIPTEVEISAIGDLGRVRVESLYAFGGLTEPKTNTEMVIRCISSSLAIPIDGYLLTDTSGLESLSDIFGFKIKGENIESLLTFRHLPKAIGIFKTAREVIKTNLSVSEGWRIIRFLAGVRSDKIDLLSLRLEDFENTALLDEKLGGYVIDDGIYQERLKVVVLNGTRSSGLAGKLARVVENLGGSVLSVGNFENKPQNTSFITTKQEESLLLERISQIFEIEDIRSQQSGVGERADIVIVVGLDIKDNL